MIASKLVKGCSHRRSLGQYTKGRPLTAGECNRYFDAIADTVRPKAYRRIDRGCEQFEVRTQAIIHSWQYFVEGLRLSGLRLSEALALTWDRPRKTSGNLIYVIADRGSMRFMIPGESQKSGEAETYVPTPEIVEFLLRTPDEDRRGKVFLALSKDGTPMQLMESISAVGSNIGKAAEIIVSAPTKKTKYASFHDLRRTFGSHWSTLVSSFVLKDLMRHADISTTEKYYVGQDNDRQEQLLKDATNNEKRRQWRQSEPEESGFSDEEKDVTPCDQTNWGTRI